MRRTLLISIALLLAAAAARPDQQNAPPLPAPPRCDSAEHRQFDFWIGSWRVESPEGKLLGTNRITRRLNDCVLHEHWEGAGGMVGESFNVWSRAKKRWHQTWIDSTGVLLLLDGGIEDGSMRLSGESQRRDGTEVMNRITWTPLEQERCRGCVRQLWEQSSDGGKSWSAVFEGIYRPAPAGEGPE